MGFFSRAKKNPFQAIEEETFALNSVAGTWPPEFKSEDDKKLVVAQWMKLLIKAQKCYEQNPDFEEIGLCALADLYRQGHNMGVENCAKNADQAIRLCLSKYPGSSRAHQIGAYFYISVPNGGSRGEICLRKLQADFGVGKNEEVERGLVFAFVNQQRLDRALEQAQFYISIFGPKEPVVGIAKAIENNTIQLIQK